METTMPPIVTENPEEVFGGCHIESWNAVSTDSFPFYAEYKDWTKVRVTAVEGMFNGELRLISALQYKEFCVVTMAHQDNRHIGKPMFCRYFDCKRREIPNTIYESFVFPLTAVHCPRRAGAKFMSLTFNATDEITDMIPLEPRIFETHPHDIGVCVGQIYGEEKKWLQVLEFVEHHRILGASMFYFTILEMDGYSKKVIEEYIRTGLAEASFVHTEYATINFLFHQIQLHECFFRSKFHSKWVINADIDERLVMEPGLSLTALLSYQNPFVCELIFSNRRVPKMNLTPQKYINDSHLIENMEFLKYQMLEKHEWPAPKIVFQPEKVHNIFMHWSWRQHPGCRIVSIPHRIGYVRHYRFVNRDGLGANWLTGRKFEKSALEANFSSQLTDAVRRKVHLLYALKSIPCADIEPFFTNLYGNDTLKCV